MCVTYAGTASASSIVTITTSRHQLQNTRAFLKSNSSDRSDKCHSRESIDLALSSFCFQKCQIVVCQSVIYKPDTDLILDTSDFFYKSSFAVSSVCTKHSPDKI